MPIPFTDGMRRKGFGSKARVFMDTLRESTRITARAFERALPSHQRKALGQYFTGLPLGKLLAHLAISPDTRTVLDPMAGHGDLLDATWEAATVRGVAIERLDGVEVDGATARACRDRLAYMGKTQAAPACEIVAGDAFDPASIRMLPVRTYDLVIANPPYVRYQGHGPGGSRGSAARAGLRAVVAGLMSGVEAKVWGILIDGYSGLADLSVPAWLLAAAMVRPGGSLALVAPATWRSRDYADVVRYLLLRCFSLECVVEDQQPGWFSDALVRTQLIVARRLPASNVAKPLDARDTLPQPVWVKVSPEAGGVESLVGAAFAGTCPEAEFAAWLSADCPDLKRGIETHPFDLNGERTRLDRRISRRRWYRKLDGGTAGLPIFGAVQSSSTVLPEALADVFPKAISPAALFSLADVGIAVGQGLRTGCNDFFYVTACNPGEDSDLFVRSAVKAGSDAVASDSSGPEEILVEACSPAGTYRFPVPGRALRPVLRRQAELTSLEQARLPEGRVLDLRTWILPEDRATVSAARAAYASHGEVLPRLMPDDLAAYVRRAAQTPAASPVPGKLIPELSAVRTNVRPPRNGRIVPRFWYMLPDFAPRHLPAAFVPRINHDRPWVEANLAPPILIDSNFSTFWAPDGGWTRHALKAFLNSVWCRAAMEALGTPLGGGALKLEATHLRHLPVPALSDADKAELDAMGKRFTRDASAVQKQVDRIILSALLAGVPEAPPSGALAGAIEKRLLSLTAARQRGRYDR